jgi:hypothetical protein
MWGFTVDDALISVRYARHVSEGLGWRYNVGGPSTDGVTPLAWPMLLLPLASGDAWAVLRRAQALGFVAHLATGALVGAVAARSAAPSWARALVLAALTLSVPVAAHAVSGMETSIAMLLATAAAASYRRPVGAGALAGAAASLRPEMVAWAGALSLGLAFAHPAANERTRWRVAAIAAAFAAGPFLACAVARAIIWGRAAPLALMAKPSSTSLGASYTAAALVVSVVPVSVAAPWALRRCRVAAALVGGAAVHAAALVVVGGDWMPFARLWAPVVPSLAIAALLAAAQASALANAARGALSIALGLTLALCGARALGAGRGVGADRRALIEAARPALAQYARVAALDVGWVGAATEADVVDLAGVTDPQVAALAGGHTSKRVSSMFLRERGVEALLLYCGAGLPPGGLAAWQEASFSRALESRLARDDVVVRHFAPVAWLPLGREGAGYVLLGAER